MSVRVHSTRRDVRHRIARGAARIELTQPRRSERPAEGDLVVVCQAGFAFEFDGVAEAFPCGRLLSPVTLHLNDCQLQGDAAVRDVRQIGEGRIEVGCLFFPAVCDEERWSAVIAGLGADPALIECPR